MEPNCARPGTWDAAIFRGAPKEYGQIDFKGRVVLDLGAHVGGFAALAASSGAARVVAYEAGAENFHLLVANCDHLGVQCRHGAVWRSDRPARVLTWAPSDNPVNTGGGGVYEGRSESGLEHVDAVPFDGIVDELGVVDLLKIDVEGSEYPILMTSQRLDRIKEIVGEWHRVPSTLNGETDPTWTPEGLIEHLEAAGFDTDATFSAASKGRLGHFRAVNRGLRPYERQVYSGSGEDGIIAEIFRRIPPTFKCAVEFGANDGVWLSNTRRLILEEGWTALLIEARADLVEKARENYRGHFVNVYHSSVTPENVEELFAASVLPVDFDLLVIDIDSFDWHVWKAIERYRPKVVCIEYNASFPPPAVAVVPYDPGMTIDAVARLDGKSDDYFGASLQALYDLGKAKGYELIYCSSDGVNAFFVDVKFAAAFRIPEDPTTLYRLPTYGVPGLGRAPNGRGHERSDRW